MLYFEADFPASTPSKELYDLLEPFGLNVTEMIFTVYVYGKFDMKNLDKIVNISYAFNVNNFHITNRADG